MQTPVGTARENIMDVLALIKCLVAKPENLTAIKLRETNEVVVIERGTQGEEGDLVAAHLTLGAERRMALGHLIHEHGRTHWQPERTTLQRSMYDVQPGRIQVLGRVLSIIHPVSQNGEPQVA
jgi:hypothetical protein